MSDENPNPPAGTPPGDDGKNPPAGDGKGKPADGSDSKPKDQQPPAGSEPKRIVPTDGYKLTLPKDSLLDQANLDAISEFAKTNKLTNEEAQAILERESATIAAYVDKAQKAAEEAFKKTQGEWLEELKADKEYGGENFGKNAELAKRVVTRFADEAFQKDLEQSGFGNHPGFNRFMLKLGKAMSEDQLVPPGAPPAGKERRSTADVLFGENPKK